METPARKRRGAVPRPSNERPSFAARRYLGRTGNPETGEIILSFSIITVPPNDLNAPVHDRMPAILGRDELDDWFTPPEEAFELLRPCPSEWLCLAKVGGYVNNSRNQEPDCIKLEDEG